MHQIWQFSTVDSNWTSRRGSKGKKKGNEMRKREERKRKFARTEKFEPRRVSFSWMGHSENHPRLGPGILIEGCFRGSLLGLAFSSIHPLPSAFFFLSLSLYTLPIFIIEREKEREFRRDNLSMKIRSTKDPLVHERRIRCPITRSFELFEKDSWKGMTRTIIFYRVK